MDLFVDFLAMKHGLAAAMRSDGESFDTLYVYFLDRLVPVFAQLFDAAAAAGEISDEIEAIAVMRGIGNLCIGGDRVPHYNARRLVGLLLVGLRASRST